MPSTHDPVSHLLRNFSLVGPESHPIAIASDAPHELAKRLKAAAVSYLGAYTGVDYVLKSFAHELDRSKDEPEAPDTVDELLQLAFSEADAATRWWTSVPKEPKPLGRFVAGSALLRAQASFTIAGFAARLGFRYECFALLRLILEQCAWAFAVKSLDGSAHLNVSVTKSVTRLRQLIPGVGRVYQTLSELAHIDPVQSRSYLAFADDEPAVTLLSPAWSKQLTWATGHMALVFAVTTESVFCDVVKGAHRLTLENGEVIVNYDGPLRRALSRHQEHSPYGEHVSWN